MSTPAFDWRNYITVSDKFGENKPLIEKALSDIAATGKDGEELIKTMYANCKGPITIELDLNIFGSSESPFSHQNTILLNPDQIKRITVNTTQGPQHLSLTGAMLHEMFHAADFNVSKAVFDYQLDHKILVSEHLTVEQRHAVQKAAARIFTDRLQSLIQTDPTLTEAPQVIYKEFQNDAQFLTKLADLAHVPRGSFTFPALTDPDFSEKLGAEATILRNQPQSLYEQDAVHYTDVFMAKHFPNEPWRGDYNNAQLGDERPLFAQAPGCGIFKPGIYVAQDANMGELGQLHQPIISSDPSPGCPVKLPLTR